MCFPHLTNDPSAWKRIFSRTPSMTITSFGYTGYKSVLPLEAAKRRLVISNYRKPTLVLLSWALFTGRRWHFLKSWVVTEQCNIIRLTAVGAWLKLDMKSSDGAWRKWSQGFKRGQLTINNTSNSPQQKHDGNQRCLAAMFARKSVRKRDVDDER